MSRVARYALETIDRFGTWRAMVARDFPADTLFGSLAAHPGAYAAITADFSQDECRALFVDNANRIYRLGLGL